MAVDAHVEALQRRHAALDEEIRELVATRRADDARITTLKREKLRIKDEIFRLTNDAATTTRN